MIVSKASCLSDAHVGDPDEDGSTEPAMGRDRELYDILPQIQDAYLRADLQGCLVAVSPSAARLYGYESPGEMLGIRAEELYADPADRLAMLQGLRDKGGLVDYVGRGRKRDGTPFWVSLNAQVIRDEHGQPAGTEGLVRDITERKGIEDQLRQVRDRLVLACRAGGVGIWELDVVTRALSWDAQMCALYGIRVESFGGTYDTWRRGVHPDDIGRVESELDEAMRGEREFDAEFRIVHPDGEIRIIRALASLQVDAHGAPKSLIGTNYDITAHRRAELALLDSQSLLAQTAQIGRVGGWEFDIDTQRQTWTDVVYQIHELDPSCKLTVEQGINFYAPASRPIIEQAVQRAVDYGEPFDLELEIITAKGNLRTVHAIGNADLGHRKVYGFFQDVTERKLSEARLESKNALLTALINSPVDIIIFSLDSEYRYTAFNDQHRIEMKRVWNADISVGMCLLDCMSVPELRASATKSIDRALRGERFAEIQHQPVPSIYYEFSWSPIQQGEAVTGVTVFIRDVTERVLAETRTRENHTRLTAVMNGLEAMIYVADMDTHEVLFVNDYGRRVWGDVIGTKCWESFQEGFLAPCPFCTNHKLLRPDGTPAAQYVWEHRNTRNGRWYECRDQAIPWIGGRLVRMEIATDITPRREAETKLKAAHEELKRSNAELEQFAYVASHDLQEPLRMVESYTRLLAERYGPQLDDKAQSYVEFARDGALRMQRLIQDLLLYSRVGTQAKESELVSPLAALQDALHNLQASIEESGATVTHSELPTVYMDAQQLLQLLQNLIGNAIKFRRDEPPRIHLSCADVGTEWRFSVADNGIGIEERFADRVFEIFQRLHTRQEYPGTGIGLAICKRIVERHGGKLWLESKPGEGTTFLFTVPKVAGPAESLSPPEPCSIPGGRKT